MTTPLIEQRGVSRRYDDGPPALHDVSLTVRTGKAVEDDHLQTVLKAYREPEDEDLVAARPGVRTFVTATLTDPLAGRARPAGAGPAALAGLDDESIEAPLMTAFRSASEEDVA